MTDRTLHVFLDGERCGELTQSSTGNLTFTYDDDYRRRDDATPLSLSMPLAARVHKKRVVLPFLQGLLPDSDMALKAISKRYSVSANNPFALIEHIGEDVAGALQILPADAPAQDATGSRFKVSTISDAEVVELLGQVVEEYESGTPYDSAAGRFSLAGAQPKIALHREGHRWGIPQDATPTTHILKPAVGGRYQRMDVVEQLSLRAADALGNQVARSELTVLGDWHVLVSERYDRRRVGGILHRLHQEDLCQSLSVSPSKKYQRADGGPGVADIAALIRSLPIESDRRVVGERFFRAFVFNIVAGCTDAHAKNYSFLLTGRRVGLAPLYDVATYAGYWDRSSKINSAMSVAGSYSLHQISAADLVSEGRKFGLSEDAASTIVDATRSGIVAAFDSARSDLLEDPAVDKSITDDVMRGIRALPLVTG